MAPDDDFLPVTTESDSLLRPAFLISFRGHNIRAPRCSVSCTTATTLVRVNFISCSFTVVRLEISGFHAVYQSGGQSGASVNYSIP
jgi:hypothetical protein